jgi:hypothetical protein
MRLPDTDEVIEKAWALALGARPTHHLSVIVLDLRRVDVLRYRIATCRPLVGQRS